MSKKLLIVWNNEDNLIEIAQLTNGGVNVMTADPKKGSALINISEVEDFQNGFRAKGYSESEIKKLDDALQNLEQ